MEETLFSDIPITSDVAADVIDVAKPIPIQEVNFSSMPGVIENTPESGMWLMTSSEPIGEDGDMFL